MAKYHLLGQLVQTKEGECEPLLVDFESDITFSPIRDKCTISSPNFHTPANNYVLYLGCRLL